MKKKKVSPYRNKQYYSEWFFAVPLHSKTKLWNPLQFHSFPFTIYSGSPQLPLSSSSYLLSFPHKATNRDHSKEAGKELWIASEPQQEQEQSHKCPIEAFVDIPRGRILDAIHMLLLPSLLAKTNNAHLVPCHPSWGNPTLSWLPSYSYWLRSHQGPGCSYYSACLRGTKQRCIRRRKGRRNSRSIRIHWPITYHSLLLLSTANILVILTARIQRIAVDKCRAGGQCNRSRGGYSCRYECSPWNVCDEERSEEGWR